jgi:hypothetical protein
MLPGVFPLFNYLLLPQANGPAFVDSGCTHPFNDSKVEMVQLGCLEVYPSTCWVSSQNMNVG